MIGWHCLGRESCGGGRRQSAGKAFRSGNKAGLKAEDIRLFTKDGGSLYIQGNSDQFSYG